MAAFVFAGGEARVDGVADVAGERVLADDLLDQRVFAADRRTEERRIVGVDRDDAAGAIEIDVRMRIVGKRRARPRVRRRANFEWNLTPRQQIDDVAIAQRVDTVPDALCAQHFDRCANALGTRGLTGVRDRLHPLRTYERKGVGE